MTVDAVEGLAEVVRKWVGGGDYVALPVGRRTALDGHRLYLAVWSRSPRTVMMAVPAANAMAVHSAPPTSWGGRAGQTPGMAQDSASAPSVMMR